MEYTLDDLIIAFRKGKSDLFYDKGHISLVKISEYEENLYINLSRLLNRLNTRDYDFFLSDEFIGTFNIVLKSLTLKKKEEKDGIYFSDEFDKLKNIEFEEPSFRYIGDHSIDFHVLSSLWIDKIGIHLEKDLLENSYGCRLEKPFVENNKDKNVNSYNKLRNHFRAYHIDYKRWQDDSVKAIENSLANKKKIVVLTTDIKGFYHSIDPRSFFNIVYNDEDRNLQLIRKHRFLNEILLTCLIKWSERNLKSLNELGLIDENYDHAGIPIGLTVSKVIANLYLKDFDNEIVTKLSTIFYGRYVDDVILILENNSNIYTRDMLWQHIKNHATSFKFEIEKESVSVSNEQFLNPIKFNKSKEKIFILNSESGASFIENIKESLKENSSEWRLLPDADDDVESLNKQISSSNSCHENSGSGLRKSDGVSIQRLKFVLRLRNFETLISISSEHVWEKGLDKFISTCADFIITPSRIVTYMKYYPRIFGLTINANQLYLTERLLESYKKCWRIIQSNLIIDNLEVKEKLEKAKKNLDSLIYEAIIANSKIDEFYDNEDYPRLIKYFKNTEERYSQKNTFERVLKLYYSDLHNVPVKNGYLEKNLNYNHELLKSYDLKKFSTISHEIEIDSYLNFSSRIFGNKFIPNALYFSTRTFSGLELTLLFPEWTSNKEEKEEIESFYELFSLKKLKIKLEDNYVKNNDTTINYISIPNDKQKDDPKIVLTQFGTDSVSWTALVRNDGYEPDSTRDVRLFRLINNILRAHVEVDYIVFPELSLPRRIIIYISNRLKSRGISLIAGIEYEKKQIEYHHNIKGAVSNQLLYILNVNNGLYNEQISIVQEKVIPAIHEESDLFNIGGLILEPSSKIKYIIKHNNFFFSGLICNELLNIDYRQPLRGLIDALFVVEWNKDVDMFSHLVSSTSIDLHCFVVQVNNRSYGDTKLRGPYKESYMRDQICIKGGELDYFVVGSIKAKELREFQRHYRSPKEPFKPVPSGFQMSDERRTKDFPDRRRF